MNDQYLADLRVMDIRYSETLDGLKKIGFQLNEGIDGSGFAYLAWSKAGGYYLGKACFIEHAFYPHIAYCHYRCGSICVIDFRGH